MHRTPNNAQHTQHKSRTSHSIILRSVLGMYVHLITHSTLCAICHTNYPRLPPRRVHSITSKATVEVVRGCESFRQNTFYLPRVVPKFHLLGVTLIGVYGLNLPEVGKLLVPSIPVKLSHMDISVEIWYNFQLDMYHFPFPAFYSYKRRQYNMNIILEK